ncbi:Glycosyltransferase, GT2 family [Nakamurella panacisegetis]|uniref:Glycosyltransferase, GT2 family n=1 Tax=Nakamurella panacisegetis TaxID=1090615 RepID=A0A1H0IJ32_9ACTN|nr:glycosyltransferase [Nakamurella panacisegetis]SDO31479.1 Glycosyltransferase, GT2 family [Nakamurella panacisegetis]
MFSVASVSVTVAILTFRRPGEVSEGLPMILDQVQQINSRPGHRADVLVVDNDPEGSARSAVSAFGSPIVRYCVEPRPGISAARNRAIDESAGSRLLAYIDDDERPEPGWLSQLLDVWAPTEPAAVSGRVIPEYERPPEPWIVAGRFFERRSLPTGTELDVAAAGNLLIDLQQVRAFGLRFDDRYGLAGGEDTLFSRALFAKGGRMLWCNESVVVDKVPAARMNREWVLRRAWSHGNTTGLIALDLTAGRARRSVRRVELAVGGLARVAVGSARSTFGRVNGSARHQARGQRLARRGGGMAAAAVGHVYQEYRRDG